jgi:lipopolysaccharide heptosyltransferase II
LQKLTQTKSPSNPGGNTLRSSSKNFLLEKLIKWAQKKAGKNRDPRFLIVSTTGLGDTLWATPAIRSLRESYPDGYISVLTSGVGKQVLEHNPHVDEIFVLKKPHLFSLFSTYRKLRKRGISQILLFHASQRMIFPFCALLHATHVIGTKGLNKGLDLVLTDPVDNTSVHEIERRLNILQKTGAACANPVLELFISDAQEKEALDYLEKKKIPSYIPLVGLHPGAKDDFKKWPEAHFIEVGKRLVEHLGCQLFVTGNEEERDLVSRIASNIPGAIALVQELSLGGISALIRKFSVMISNDTGPMHLSFAVGTPTVALFTPTDPRLCGPYFAEKNRILKKEPTCKPCLRKKCKDPFCLLQISPKEVYDAALSLL